MFQVLDSRGRAIAVVPASMLREMLAGRVVALGAWKRHGAQGRPGDELAEPLALVA